MVAYSTTRTEVEYPTHGPGDGTGESWGDYFQRILHPDEPDDEQPERTRSRTGHGVLFDGLEPRPNSGVGYYNSLIKAGFEVKVDWVSWIETGGVYGDSAQKAGQPYPDREGITLIIQAYKPGHLLKLGFECIKGKWTCEWRQINKQYTLPSDKEVKAWIATTSD